MRPWTKLINSANFMKIKSFVSFCFRNSNDQSHIWNCKQRAFTFVGVNFCVENHHASRMRFCSIDNFGSYTIVCMCVSVFEWAHGNSSRGYWMPIISFALFVAFFDAQMCTNVHTSQHSIYVKNNIYTCNAEHINGTSHTYIYCGPKGSALGAGVITKWKQKAMAIIGQIVAIKWSISGQWVEWWNTLRTIFILIYAYTVHCACICAQHPDLITHCTQMWQNDVMRFAIVSSWPSLLFGVVELMG